MNLRGVKDAKLILVLHPDFLTAFFIEDFDVNFLTDELLSTFFIKEDSKTYEETMRSIVVSL